MEMDPLQAKLFDVFQEMQKSSSCHQHYMKVLSQIYKQSSFEDFIEAFVNCLEILFSVGIIKNVAAEKCLEFAGDFVINLEHQLQRQPSHEYESHPSFLTAVVHHVLEFHHLKSIRLRFHCCSFMHILLHCPKSSEVLDDELCSYIQDAMMQRIMDPNPAVRLKAFSALVRLQDPNDKNCPVIRAFVSSFLDRCPLIRKYVIENVAPSVFTLPKLIENVLDMDCKVRAAVLSRCSKIHPKCLKIAERQKVCFVGVQEQNANVKRVFVQELLVNWVNAYNGDFVKFITNIVKLDGEENDQQETLYLGKHLLEEIFKLYPLRKIIGCLQLEDNKLVPFDTITSEMALYWNSVHGYCVSSDTDEIVDAIVPELSPFCDYVESIILEKHGIELTDWEFLKHQFILSNLFEMIGRFDFSDVVGRNRLHHLVNGTLIKRKLDANVLTILINILEKLNDNTHQLVEEVCELISNMQGCNVTNFEKSQLELQKHNSEISKLNERIEELSADVEKAIEEHNFRLISDFEDEISKLKKTSKALQKSLIIPEQISNEHLRICRCLDILNTVLVLEKVDRLNPTLRQFKNDFLTSLSNASDMDIYRKIFKCCILLALIDKRCATDYLHIIYTPIIWYECNAEYEKEILLMSIKAVPDLLFLYGPNLFADIQGIEEIETGFPKFITDNDHSEYNAITRMFDTLMLILQDECLELRECSSLAINFIVHHGLLVTPSLLTQILLKWHNPQTEVQLPKTYQLFGGSIMHFAHSIKKSESVIRNTILLTVKLFSNASCANLTAGVDIDAVIKFLGPLTSVKNNEDTNEMQKILLLELCTNISEQANVLYTIVGVKMLTVLNVPTEDKTFLRDIYSRVETISMKIVDKNCKQKLKKYLQVLSSKLGTESNTANEKADKKSTTSKKRNRKSHEGDISEVTDELDIDDKSKRYKSDNLSDFSLSIRDDCSANSTEAPENQNEKPDTSKYEINDVLVADNNTDTHHVQDFDSSHLISVDVPEFESFKNEFERIFLKKRSQNDDTSDMCSGDEFLMKNAKKKMKTAMVADAANKDTNTLETMPRIEHKRLVVQLERIDA